MQRIEPPKRFAREEFIFVRLKSNCAMQPKCFPLVPLVPVIIHFTGSYDKFYSESNGRNVRTGILKNSQQNVWLGKCPVREVSGQGSVLSEKCHVRELSGQGSVR